MSRHPYPVRVSDSGVAAIRNPEATGSEATPWLITDNAPGTDAQVEGWTSYVSFDKVGAAVFADALNEWAAHWPPRVGQDVTLEPIYAALNDLTPEQLEQVAVAASALSQRCWEIRGPKLVEETRKEQGILWASVNVTADGRLLPSSVVTVDEVSVPVPLSTDTGGVIAAHRLSVALRTLGYKAIDWRDTTLDGERLSFLVRKVPTNE